jgi:hypothetical protein
VRLPPEQESQSFCLPQQEAGFDKPKTISGNGIAQNEKRIRRSGRDGMAQAEPLRRKEVSPVELVNASISSIEELKPELNALITQLFDKARALAQSGEISVGPFRGVPFLLGI